MNTRMNTSVAVLFIHPYEHPLGPQLFIHAACCNTPQVYERSYVIPDHLGSLEWAQMVVMMQGSAQTSSKRGI